MNVPPVNARFLGPSSSKCDKRLVFLAVDVLFAELLVFFANIVNIFLSILLVHQLVHNYNGPRRVQNMQCLVVLVALFDLNCGMHL
jgi:hypothetical protein